MEQFYFTARPGQEYPRPLSFAPESTFLSNFARELATFDIDTIAIEHEVLQIDMPKYLFAQSTLPDALRNKTLLVRLEYDGKYLAFEATIGDCIASTASARIVPSKDGIGAYTLADHPNLTSAEARSLVAFVMGYSRARVVRINSH